MAEKKVLFVHPTEEIAKVTANIVSYESEGRIKMSGENKYQAAFEKATEGEFGMVVLTPYLPSPGPDAEKENKDMIITGEVYRVGLRLKDEIRAHFNERSEKPPKFVIMATGADKLTEEDLEGVVECLPEPQLGGDIIQMIDRHI